MPVTERTSTIAGADTRWWEHGPAEAPLVIAVHGFRGDHHGLEQVVARLPEYRVIMPDLPGFGDSGTLPEPHTVDAYAQWLREFADAVAPGRSVTLLGHSFGSIVVAAAVDRGLAADRVILVNPIAAPALRGPKAVGSLVTLGFYRLAAVLPDRVGRALLGSPFIVRAMSEAMAKTKDRPLRAWIHDQHARYFSRFATRESVLEAFEASIGDDVASHAAALTMPVLLVAAAQDQIVALADVRALATRLPQARLRVLEGVGHLIHYERPAEAAEAIGAFLAR